MGTECEEKTKGDEDASEPDAASVRTVVSRLLSFFYTLV